MTEHYYAKDPKVDSAPMTWEFLLRGKTFTFTSDKGVFSKREVDFGSRQLIEHFEEPQVEGDILDLGCGYGPIGIALAHTYKKRHVTLTDINERALGLAEQNRKQNHVENITIIHSDGLSEVIDQSFAAIVTNPPIRAGKKIIYGMFHDAKTVLKEKGQFWTVIQKKQGAPSAKKTLQEIFGNVTVVGRNKGYFILRATKV